MTVYKVTGNTRFMGHQPGEEFEADLTEEQELRGKRSGAIRVVKRNKPEKEQEEADDA